MVADTNMNLLAVIVAITSHPVKASKNDQITQKAPKQTVPMEHLLLIA